MKELKVGDPITHMHIDFVKDAVITGNDFKNIWSVSYTSSSGKRIINGHWCKEYCIYREPIPECDEIEFKCDKKRFGKLIEYEETTNSQLNALCSFKTNLEKIMETEIKTIFINGKLADTTINGESIKVITSSSILHYINSAEDVIHKLKRHGEKSMFVKQEKKRLKTFIKTCYALLDAKFTKEEKNEK